jgi:hypothetical protein
MQSRWLAKHGIELPARSRPAPVVAESGGLRMVGKWGRGPSWEVTGRDSLLFLSLGSEVAIINAADPHNPKVLAEVQAPGLVANAAVRDSFLYVGYRRGSMSCASGIDVWNIEDLTEPVFRGRVSANLDDFCVQDTFAYVTLHWDSPSQDTFKVFNLADPANPRLIGWCRDSGEAIAVSGTKVVVSDWNDIHIMDVSDPTHPRRAGSIGIGSFGVDVRGNLVCANRWLQDGGGNDYFWVDMFDISDPAAPRFLGEADSVGGYDIHLSGPLAFASGYYYGWGFAILDISDSTRPHVISRAMTPGQRSAVWADWTSNWAYVADMVGLAVMDISNINSPHYDTTVMTAHAAQDVWLDQGRAYVADGAAGLRILDVTDPTAPVDLGGIDTLFGDSHTAVARDSFAFVGWMSGPHLRSISVIDPAHPVMAGGAAGLTVPVDMVLRDTLVYLAGRFRFQVVNVASPRQPMLVGSCVLQDESYGLCLVDSLAYVATYPFSIINVKDPTNPVVVGTITRGAYNGTVRDTFLFLSSGGVLVYSVADPTQPRLIDSLSLGPNTYWVEAVGTLLYAGSADGVRVVDASDVHNMRVRGFAATPRNANRLTYKSPYIYASCSEGGVCIFESTQVAVAEPKQGEGTQARKGASVVRGVLFLPDAPSHRSRAVSWLLDVSGRKVLDLHPGANDVRTLAPGVYFVREEQDRAQAIRKLVITQ